MRVLLDTAAVAWLLLDSPLLTRPARDALRRNSQLFFSAASCFEIATKVRLGKWPKLAAIEARMLDELFAAQVELLPVTGPVALHAGRLSQAHKDPFDRLIAAHALHAECAIVSPDRVFDIFGLHRIW